MTRHTYRARDSAEDMLRLCLKIDRLISGISEAQLISNETTLDSVILTIANIGEAAKRFIDTVPDASSRFPAIPFSAIYLMRNRVLHGYHVVDFGRIWQAASQELPPVRAALEAALANWPSDLTEPSHPPPPVRI